MKEVTFLIGAGVSQGAGFPSVCELTTAARAGKDAYYSTSDDRFIFRPGLRSPESARVVEEVKQFLAVLHQHADAYYQHEDHVTYEDLASMVWQLDQSERGEWDNPALGPLIDTLRIPCGGGVGQAAHRAKGYLRDVVRYALEREPVTFTPLAFVVDATRAVNVGRCSIFTLNHDLFIEKTLRRAGVTFTDGFVSTSSMGALWKPEVFDEPGVRTRLYKLHGSISWRLMGDHTGRSVVLRTPDGPTVPRPVGTDGRPLREWEPAVLLLGIHAKVFHYLQALFADLFWAFRQHLRTVAHSVVVCGYGFGDKFINATLLDWLADADGRRLIVVHPDPDSLKGDARPAVGTQWDVLRQKGQLNLVQARAEDVSWSTLRPLTI